MTKLQDPCIPILERNKPIIIYIGGLGRSGSTLLAEILATIPGFVSVGELPTLWRHGWQDDWQSSDGYKFSTSPVWQSLVARLYEDDDDFDPKKCLELCERVSTRRHLLAFGTRSYRKNIQKDLNTYIAHFEKVYHILAIQADARVIIDSGKSPFHAALMSESSEVDFRTVHLIRDPRAVAFSRMRRKINKNTTTGISSLMVRQSSTRIALRWSWQNFLMSRLQCKTLKGVQSSYETLAESPEVEIRRILTELNLSCNHTALDSLSAGAFTKQPGIAFSGNSSRFDFEQNAIRIDDIWKKELPWLSYCIVSVLTYPARYILATYNYSKLNASTKARENNSLRSMASFASSVRNIFG